MKTRSKRVRPNSGHREAETKDGFFSSRQLGDIVKRLVKSAMVLLACGIDPRKHKETLTQKPKPKGEPIVILGQGDYQKKIYG
jgi:hypothetical protein